MLKAYVQTDEKFNVILAYSTIKQGATYHEVIQDNPTIDISKLCGYKLTLDDNNEYHLVFDQDKYAKIVGEQQKEQAIKNGNEMVNKLTEQKVLTVASDEDAYAMRYLYPTWSADSVEYKKDQRLMYNDKFYKVIKDHTSQESWTPDSASSLFVEISDPQVEYPEWKQPTMTENAYMKDSKVAFEGNKYISLIDNNVWSPATYPSAWELVKDNTDNTKPDIPQAEEYPEFVKPTGSHDAYKIGDKVTYNGKKYVCKQDNCVYSPDELKSAWELVG